MSESLCSNCNHGNTLIDYPCNICVNYDQWEQEPEDEATTLRQLLTSATERAEKAESQRDRMREALERMVGLWERVHSPQVLLGRPTLNAAKKVLKEVGDE